MICAYNLSILPTCFIKVSLNSKLVIKGSALKCATLYFATPFSFNVSTTMLTTFVERIFEACCIFR